MPAKKKEPVVETVKPTLGHDSTHPFGGAVPGEAPPPYQPPNASGDPPPVKLPDHGTAAGAPPPVVIPDPDETQKMPPPEAPKPKEQKPAPAAKPAPGVYDVNADDLRHFQENKLKEEKQKSLDAIEDAVRSACKIAEDKIRREPVVVALAQDPGDIEKRLAFLEKFGPSGMKPPKPKAGPHGIKDENVMRWIAKYEPAEFVATYGKSKAPLVVELMKSIPREFLATA